MREIGSIAREKDAQALADYLLTLDISTKLAARGDGSWAVWVHREDRVPEARAILEEFARDPADTRYSTASQAARSLRKKAEKDETDYRKRVRNLRDRWEGPLYRRAPVTFALMVTSVLVTAFQNAPVHLNPPIYVRLAFSIQTIDAEGFIRDSGFEEIRRGEVWRLITPIFLHFGIAHLFFNMMALLVFGSRIEFRKGTGRLALLVVVSAIASNVGQFFHSGGAFGGMSGVVFALGGYLWVKGHAHPEDGLSLDQRSTTYLIGWFLLGIVLSQSAPAGARGFPYNMANVAHGVGLAVGMVFGLLRL